MILDFNTLFTGVKATGVKYQDVGSQAIGSVASTNVVDLGSAQTDAAGELVIVITEAVTSAGAATVQFALQDCDTVGGTYVTRVETGAIGKATLVVGYQVQVPIPANLQQFVRLYVTVGTADLTAGMFIAGLNLTKQTNA